MVSRFKIFYHQPSLKENYNEADQIGSSSLFLPPIAVFIIGEHAANLRIPRSEPNETW